MGPERWPEQHLMAAMGFIGTGTITAAIVEGMRSTRFADVPVLVSPRNDAIARRLAADHGSVEIASDNQDVADRSEVLVLAVRPQVAEAVLKGLRLHPDRKVISLIAGLDHRTIAEWTGAEHVCRAIPLPFVAKGRSMTPVFPPQPEAIALFEALGGALPVTDIGRFDGFATLSALMGTYFGIAEIVTGWAHGQGLADEASRPYVAELFGNLGDILRDHPMEAEALRRDHSTRGGLNEQLFVDFRNKGGEAALYAGLDAVLRRISKA